MAETCTPEQLPRVIERYMREYGEKAEKAVRKDILSVSKEAQDKLRSTSPRRYGSYAESWSRRIQNGSLGSVTTTLYSRLPGLPHLLEFGHALRGGGRARAMPHIAPVESWANTEVERKIRQDLSKIH